MAREVAPDSYYVPRESHRVYRYYATPSILQGFAQNRGEYIYGEIAVNPPIRRGKIAAMRGDI